MTDINRLYVLLCGYEIIRKSGCMRDAPGYVLMAVPICCYLLDTNQGYVLFDTGINSARLQDPLEAHRLFANHTFPAPPIVLPEHEVHSQLRELNVSPHEVSHILLSHAHGDHTGHLADFPEADIWIQRAEHEFAFSAEGRSSRTFGDIEAKDLRWHILDGDTAVMPGLDLLYTPGHRPGHQSAQVSLPSGKVKILTGDVADLLENFEREVLGGATDDKQALASIRRLKHLAATTGAELVPLHDPEFVEHARLAPEFYS